jgi:ORF6N domain
MFRLTKEEVDCWLRSRSQIAILRRGKNIKYLPYAFTEHGTIMAANVLNSPQAVRMSVFVVRAFIKLREMLATQKNESVGAGYIDRNWPPALKESGAWPLASLRQSFLNGALTRLLDPDAVLRNKIVEFVSKGDFGLASGQKPDGNYERIWFEELISTDEITFESGVFLLTKTKAKALKAGVKLEPGVGIGPGLEPVIEKYKGHEKEKELAPGIQTKTLRLVGTVPPEIWNRLGTKIIPKLKSGSDLKIGVDFSVTINAEAFRNMESEIKQVLDDLGLTGKIKIEYKVE